MTSKSIFTALLFVFTISSCVETSNDIIPVDFEKYKKEFIPGLTQKRANEILSKQRVEVLEKTIGKEIPDSIFVKNENGEVELKKLLTEKTLLVLTASHCAWGMEGLTNDMPYALNKLKEEKIEINVICLFIKTEFDDEDITYFNTTYNELKVFYPNIYVISEKDSRRLNVTVNPARMLIDQDKSVISKRDGVSTPEGLYEELKKLLQTKANQL